MMLKESKLILTPLKCSNGLHVSLYYVFSSVFPTGLLGPSASEGQSLMFVPGQSAKPQEFCSHLFNSPIV